MPTPTEIHVSQILPGTAYQLIGTNSGATKDVYLSLAGTTNQISVGTAGTTLTLSTPQDIATVSTPTFQGLTLTRAGTTTLSLNATGVNQAAISVQANAKNNQISTGSDGSFVITDTDNAVNFLSYSRSANTLTLTASSGIVSNNSVILKSQSPIVFQDTAGTPKSVTLEAPTTITTSYTLKWPLLQGASSTVLTNDGSGNLSWVTGGSGTVNSGSSGQIAYYASTGAAVSGSSPLSISGTILTLTASTGAAELDLITSATAAPQIKFGNANSRNLIFAWNNSDVFSILDVSGSRTPISYDKVNNLITLGASSGTVTPISSSGSITLLNQHALVFQDTGSNTITLQSPTTITSSHTLKLPVAQGAASTVLTNDGSGNLSWSTVSATPGGSNTQLQYNNSGAFGGVSSGTTGQVLTSNGTGVLPSFQAASGGTTSQAVYTVGTSSGTYTGSTTVFNLPFTYVQDNKTLQVMYNGQVLVPGTDYTETSSTSITTTSALVSGASIVLRALVAATQATNSVAQYQNYVVGTASGTYTGSTTVFNIPFAYTQDGKSLQVYYDGVQLVLGDDYTETTTTSITTTQALVSGQKIAFRTISAAGTAAAVTNLRENYVVGTASGNYTGSTTVFNLVNSYIPGGVNLAVFLDGDLQTVGATIDYLETNSTTVTFNNALVTGQKVTFLFSQTTAAAGTVSSATANQLAYYPSTGSTISGNTHILTDSNGELFVTVSAGSIPLTLTNTGTQEDLQVFVGSSTQKAYISDNTGPGVDVFSLAVNRSPAYATYNKTGQGSAMINLYSASTVGEVDIYSSTTNNGSISLAASFADNGCSIKGTTTNNAANAGYYGEYVESVASGTNFPASTNYGDLTSISLTAGDWDVTAILNVSGTVGNNVQFGISITSGNSNTGLVEGSNFLNVIPNTSVSNCSGVISSYRISLASTTTVYYKYRGIYSGAAPVAEGRLSARRMR